MQLSIVCIESVMLHISREARIGAPRRDEGLHEGEYGATSSETDKLPNFDLLMTAMGHEGPGRIHAGAVKTSPWTIDPVGDLRREVLRDRAERANRSGFEQTTRSYFFPIRKDLFMIHHPSFHHTWPSSNRHVPPSDEHDQRCRKQTRE